jgi:hypothetical protein
VQGFEQAPPLAQDEFDQVQQERQGQQAGPEIHGCRNAPTTGVEGVTAADAETSAGRGGDLPEQLGVVAELLHLVFLPVKADFGEGARIDQRRTGKPWFGRFSNSHDVSGGRFADYYGA